jgi:hypothetical protein
LEFFGLTSSHERFQNPAMNATLSIEELEKRWEKVLVDTGKAVAEHPHVYRGIKSLIADVVTKPLDIKDYPVTAEKLVKLLKTIGCNAQGSIFHFYYDRVAPSSICSLKLFRVECHDLLAHLMAFDEWRKKVRHLRIVK